MFAPRRSRRRGLAEPWREAICRLRFFEAGHVVVAWKHGLKVHRVTIVPTPGFRGHIWHANPLRGIHLDYDGSDRARLRAEVGIIVCLAGPEAQWRFSPRSWRLYHGATDHEMAVDLAISINGSNEASSAHLAPRDNLQRVIGQMKAFLLDKCRPIIPGPVPTINLTDDELAAVTAAIRRAIEDDRFPHAPRLNPLRAALGKFEAASEPAPLQKAPPAAKVDKPAR